MLAMKSDVKIFVPPINVISQSFGRGRTHRRRGIFENAHVKSVDRAESATYRGGKTAPAVDRIEP